MFITQWVPGTYPIPFFQTWCCENSSITPLPLPLLSPSPGNWHDLKLSGLPPKMYDCVHHNLLMNRVGVDCIHYLFNDDECRAFIAREYPLDVIDAYDNLIPTAFKADLWRYCVLYMYGGVYLDIKLQFCGGGGGGGGGGVSLRSIVERWTSGDGGDGGDGGGLFVLERDAVGLWSPGRFGIHNAFIITKPKNPILLECIFRIVSASKVGGWGVTGAYDVGWMTRPLFVTGPGLLGDVWRWWRSRQSSGGGGGDVSDSYATMAPYFRFFFEGDGRIGYFMGDGRYVQLLKVYDGYRDEYNHIAVHRVPHYTVLWSQGVVWGFRPPATGYCSAFAERSVAATLDRPKGASPRKT